MSFVDFVSILTTVSRVEFRTAKKASEQGFRNVLSEKKLKEKLEDQHTDLETLRAEVSKWRKKNYPHFKAHVKPASIPQ